MLIYYSFLIFVYNYFSQVATLVGIELMYSYN